MPRSSRYFRDERAGWVRGLPLKTQRARFEWGTDNPTIMKWEGFVRATCHWRFVIIPESSLAQSAFSGVTRGLDGLCAPDLKREIRGARLQVRTWNRNIIPKEGGLHYGYENHAHYSHR